VLEQALQDADGRVEGTDRRAVLLLAVPSSVFHLLPEESIDDPLHVLTEVRTQRHHAPVDTWLDLACEEGSVVPPVPGDVVADEPDRAASLFGLGIQPQVPEQRKVQETAPFGVRIRARPEAVRPLEREQLGAPTFRGHAGALGGDLLGRCIEQVAHDLPADGRVRVEEPVDYCHQRSSEMRILARSDV